MNQCIQQVKQELSLAAFLRYYISATLFAPTAWFVSGLYIRSNSPDTVWCAESKKQTKKMWLSGPAHLLHVWDWPFLFLVLFSHNLYKNCSALKPKSA